MLGNMAGSGRHSGQNKTLSSYLNFKHEIEQQREQTESCVKLYNPKAYSQ